MEDRAILGPRKFAGMWPWAPPFQIPKSTLGPALALLQVGLESIGPARRQGYQGKPRRELSLSGDNCNTAQPGMVDKILG